MVEVRRTPVQDVLDKVTCEDLSQIREQIVKLSGARKIDINQVKQACPNMQICDQVIDQIFNKCKYIGRMWTISQFNNLGLRNQLCIIILVVAIILHLLFRK